jgi:hypothetical protein
MSTEHKAISAEAEEPTAFEEGIGEPWAHVINASPMAPGAHVSPTTKQPAERPLQFALDFGGYGPDIGLIQISGTAFTHALITELQRMTGAYQGRGATREEETALATEVAGIHTRIGEAVEQWLRDDAGPQLNEWLRILLFGELFVRAGSVDEILLYLESSVERGHSQAFALPSVQQAIHHIQKKGTTGQRRQLRRVLKHMAPLAGGRQPLPIEERADVKLAREAREKGVSQTVKDHPKQSPESLVRAIRRGNRLIKESGQEPPSEILSGTSDRTTSSS